MVSFVSEKNAHVLQLKKNNNRPNQKKWLKIERRTKIITEYRQTGGMRMGMGTI